ncbi:methyltransferase type 11 [Fibrella aestuarina BUZ 2]|uniref:Methyltransferase type 11 n=1 Tax=Fibrella aestuarina BUZ 2 TaxID=1166018 RepID=I0KF72_9BACT|nr:class I SAM-dependent methyltransferase [Fibrella aestuarina]CCH02775.1 methyltransferase type 11 [Fibrella aestuarina BUZ 2]
MWYTDFFHGLPQRTWKAAQTDDQTQLELERVIESMEFGPGDRVLDVFCGYGRHALPLARMGAEVTGIDISAESIAELQADAQRENVPLRAIQADFLTTPLDVLGGAGSFQAVYCLGNSFCFFEHGPMQAFVERMAALLEPGGRLLVQSSMVAESLLPDFQERTWLPVGDDVQVLMEADYDPLTARLTQQLTYIQHAATGVETAQRTAEYTIYTIAELVGFLRRAGLITLAVYGTVEGDDYRIGDEGVWLLAERISH